MYQFLWNDCGFFEHPLVLWINLQKRSTVLHTFNTKLILIAFIIIFPTSSLSSNSNESSNVEKNDEKAKREHQQCFKRIRGKDKWEEKLVVKSYINQ